MFYNPKGINSASKEKVKNKVEAEEDYDPIEYPEKYRKSGHVKGSNQATNPPFDIGIIQEIRYKDFI